MTYTVLARRYRSRSFDEVVGQETIAQTLQAAMESDRVGHAYLFCGTRGIGKTTMARLFAAALNTPGTPGEAEAIQDAVMRGEDLDVIEIDGASNRGVQEARDLIANAGLAPTRSPYKIYIIDEVHMLTTESFNTLLKTMEEPPPHVKFILCTTEPNKVLHTIQSRCQRFDFRPIPSALIAAHLREVLSAEGVEAEDALLGRVAEMGNGSMRDALSVMERLLAGGHTSIDSSTMDQVLGLPDQQRIANILASILDGNPGEALEGSAALLADGSSLERVLGSLIESLRALLLMTTCGTNTELIEITETAREVLGEQAKRLDAAGALHLLALCEHASRASRLSASARAVFDATIVRMALAENLADVQSVLDGTARPSTQGSAEKKTTRKPASKPRKERVATSVQPEPTVAAEVVEATPSPLPTAGDPLDVDELWSRVQELATTAGTRAKVMSFRPVEIVDGVLQLEIIAVSGGEFLRDHVDSLEGIVSEAAGMPLQLEVLPATASQQHPAAGLEPGASADVVEAVQDDPAVRLASDLLEAVVIDVDRPVNKTGK